uniref:Ig-like domain-containing protein n=1 Tax=Stegastes partitus TaxID=144197 RepID=A0A3B5BIH7_9TELE
VCACVFLLLLHFATQSHLLIQADCNENASLSCPGVSSQMNFLAVAWYKLFLHYLQQFSNKDKLGIIRIRKSDGRITPYNLSRNASFGHDYSLLMPRVKPEDSGTYECALTANVGGQNLYHQIQLMVQGRLLTSPYPSYLVETILDLKMKFEMIYGVSDVLSERVPEPFTLAFDFNGKKPQKLMCIMKDRNAWKHFLNFILFFKISWHSNH